MSYGDQVQPAGSACGGNGVFEVIQSADLRRRRAECSGKSTEIGVGQFRARNPPGVLALPLGQRFPNGFTVFRADVGDAHEELVVRLGVEEARLRGRRQLTLARIDEMEDQDLVTVVPEELQVFT